MIRQLTIYEFQEHALKLARRQKLQNKEFVWTMHEGSKPVTIVSLRAMPGHFGSHSPTFGNRLAVQLVARFETLQVCVFLAHRML